MRIQSNFKDYYDKMQAYTFGKSSVYTRAWAKSTLKDTPLHRLQSSIGRLENSLFCVGFCGKLYYGRRIFWYDYIDTPFGKRSKSFSKYFFDIESLKSYHKAKHPHGVNWWDKEDERKLAPSFQIVEDDSFFIKENAPILFFDYDDEISCPLELKGRIRHHVPNFSLESIGFETIVNSESAYTELCGYITGVLGLEHKEVPEMTNSVKIEQHGFNKKSFRRQ